MKTYYLEDPHPWSGERWFVDILYRELKKDWPDIDKEYLFRGSAIKCREGWKTMKKSQKKRFERYAKIDKTQCEKAAEKVKDSHAPKRPPSGYMRFYKDKMQMIKEENPSFTIIEMGKESGRMWKGLSEQERKLYNDKFKEELDIYKAKLAEYKNSLK